MVLRCDVQGNGLPETVIVKHEPGENEDDSPNYHFRNELATLQFLGSDSSTEPLAPRLYTAEAESNVLVIEDFGPAGTLQDLLLDGDDMARAEQALVTYGAYLGRFHAATAGRESAFNTLPESLAAIAPDCDTNIDVRTLHPQFAEMLQAFDISADRQFDAEYEAVGAAMGEPGPFWTLTHCDAGPHNVLLSSDRAILIDFEFGQYAFCLMDMVSARMGFPHAFKGQRVPPHPLRQMEQAYRHELAQHMQQAADDRLFETALTQACAAWALGRLSHFWKGFLREYLEGSRAMAEGGDSERVERIKRWQATCIRCFIETADEFDCLPATREVLLRLEKALLQLWPDFAPMPYYPVLEL